MKCPLCIVELIVADRQGIEVDYCPTCRGVWLDRGELDKLIDRSIGSMRGRSHGNASAQDDSDVYYPTQDKSSEDHGKYPPRKRSSFLRDLFDFG